MVPKDSKPYMCALARWQFALDEPAAQASSGGPLFVGSLPTRQPDAYYALLPMRPAKLAKVCKNIWSWFLTVQRSRSSKTLIAVAHS